MSLSALKVERSRSPTVTLMSIILASDPVHHHVVQHRVVGDPLAQVVDVRDEHHPLFELELASGNPLQRGVDLVEGDRVMKPSDPM